MAVILKAPATRAVCRSGSRRLDRENAIPVATFVTDLPETTSRLAYIGIDNRKAGATAAGLMAAMLRGPERPEILITLSSARFSGEAERAERALKIEFAALCPTHRHPSRSAEGMGLDPGTRRHRSNRALACIIRASAPSTRSAEPTKR